MKGLNGIAGVSDGRAVSEVLAEVFERFDKVADIPGVIDTDLLVEAETLTGVRRERIYDAYLDHLKTTSKPSGFVFSPVLLSLYYALGGNLSRLYERLRERRWPLLPDSYSSFYRAFKRDVPEGLADYLGLSSEGLLERMPFLVWHVEETNRVWHVDATKLKLKVLKHDSRRDKPSESETTAWQLNVWEGRNRYLLSTVVVDDSVKAADVAGVLASAMRWRPEGPSNVYVGGLPGEVLTDNGTENIAAFVSKFLATVGVEQRLTRRYMKETNGKAERNGYSFSQMLIEGLPNGTRNPARFTKSGAMEVDLHRSVSVTYLNERAQELRHEWNWKRRHRILKDVPGKAWAASDGIFAIPTVADLAPYFPIAQGKDGIRTYSKGRFQYLNRDFIAVPGHTSTSRPCEVLVRHPHGDDRVLWAFYNSGAHKGELFGQFQFSEDITPAQAAQLDSFRIGTVQVAEDSAAFGAVLQALEPQSNPVDTAFAVYGEQLHDVEDFAWVTRELVAHEDLLGHGTLDSAVAETLDKARDGRKSTTDNVGQVNLFGDVTLD